MSAGRTDPLVLIFFEGLNTGAPDGVRNSAILDLRGALLGAKNVRSLSRIKREFFGWRYANNYLHFFFIGRESVFSYLDSSTGVRVPGPWSCY